MFRVLGWTRHGVDLLLACPIKTILLWPPVQKELLRHLELYCSFRLKFRASGLGLRVYVFSGYLG